MTLESLSLAVPIAAALLFSGALVAAWRWPVTLTVAGATAVALTAFWVGHRRRYPASIAPPVPDPESETGEDDGRWDWFTLLLLGVSLVAVVVVGVVARFVVPLLAIVLLALAYGDAGLGRVLAATGCTLAVAFVLELGLVLPLSRRWDLAIDDDPRPREDFCQK